MDESFDISKFLSFLSHSLFSCYITTTTTTTTKSSTNSYLSIQQQHITKTYFAFVIFRSNQLVKIEIRNKIISSKQEPLYLVVILVNINNNAMCGMISYLFHSSPV